MLNISFSPFPVLTTERLLLRSITLADAKQVFSLRSDAESMQFLDKEPLQTIVEAELLIKKIMDDVTTNDGITWAIALKEKPAVMMGSIGFWKLVKEHHRAEIGYMLLPEYFKKGYMKEAIKEVITYGFDNMKLHSIEANINPANEASETLLKSAGFIKEAYFRENFYFRGAFKDSAIYSLIDTRPA